MVQCEAQLARPGMATTRQTAGKTFVAHRDRAYLLALRVTRNAADAEDAVQEAYVRALRSPAALGSEEDERRWFLTVVINAARDQLRQRKRHESRGDQLMNGTDAQTEGVDAAEKKELAGALQNALNALDERFRLPLSLHYEQGLSHAQAAKILGLPHATVRVYAMRGLDMLRDELSRLGFAVDVAGLTAVLAGASSVPAPAALVAAVERIVSSGITASKAGAGAGGVVAAFSAKSFVAAALGAVLLASGGILLSALPSAPESQLALGGSDAEAREDARPAKLKGKSVLPPVPEAFKAALNRKVDEIYIRDPLQMVLYGLASQTRLRVRSSQNIKKLLFSFNAQDRSVLEVLESIVKTEGLMLEWTADGAVIWRAADDATLERLGRMLGQGTLVQRREAACELGTLPDRRAVPLLVEAIRQDDAEARMWAVFSLHAFQDVILPRDIPADFSALLLKHVPPVRDAAYRAAVVQLLGHARDTASEKALIEFFNQPDGSTRDAAVAALGNIRSPKAVETLLTRLGDARRETRDAVATALIGCNDERVLNAMLAQAKRMPLYTIETVILASLPTDRLWDEINTLADDNDAVVRTNAVKVLGCMARSHHQAAVARAIGFLKDRDTTVSQTAAWALWMAGRVEAEHPLIEYFEGAEFEGKRSALLALGKMRSKTATDWLKKKYVSFDDGLKAPTVWALALARDDKALELAAPQLKNDDIVAARTARYALFDLNLPEAEQLLAENAVSEADPMWFVGLNRSNSISIDEKTFQLVIKAVTSPDRQVRDMAETMLRRYLPITRLAEREKLKKALAVYEEQEYVEPPPPVDPAKPPDF